MAKNPTRKSAKKDDSMTPAMKIFLVGLVAELYLLIVRRFYVNGTIQQVVAWDEHRPRDRRDPLRSLESQ